MSGSGADAFSRLLYPMLSAQPSASAAVLEELAAAPRDKLAESNRLRLEVLERSGTEIVACAHALAARVRRGGRVLACGNGGSATGAADLVAELMAPPPPHRAVGALCLTADVSVVTAIANDIGVAEVFTRQLMALGRPEDAVVAVSTSGNSPNLVAALREAAGRGMLTVSLTGYDGGRMATEGRPDHSLVVRSSSVHRIQEVQTTLQHLLLELLWNELEQEER